MAVSEDYTYWVEKILASRHFSSGNDARLLRYLVDATYKGNNLKETVIAIDIFERDDTFSPGDDSVVRSSIYNLRKKLNVYYLDEGKSDELRLSIPKGSYQVQFEQYKPTKTPSAVSKTNLRFIYPLLVLVLLIIATALLMLNLQHKEQLQSMQNVQNNNYFWGDFIQSENPLLIVIGDYFMIEKTQPDDSTTSYIRETDINNQQDFLNYLEKYPERKNELRAFGGSYFGEEIPWCLNEVKEVFSGHNKQIAVKYASEVTFAEVKNHDVIFIGDFSTLGNLSIFVDNTRYKYSLSPPTLTYVDGKNDTLERILIRNPEDEVFQNDYALVTKIKGYEDKNMLFFLSFAPFGKSEAIYQLTTGNAIIEELTTRLTPLPEHWDLLIKVSGIESSGFYYDIVHFDAIEY